MLRRAAKTLLILIAILTGLALIAPKIASHVDDEKMWTRDGDIEAITLAVKNFERQNGNLPKSLAALATDGFLPRDPIDPWGTPYYYSITQPTVATSQRPFYIWSFGEDQRTGGSGVAQDFGNWMVSGRK